MGIRLGLPDADDITESMIVYYAAGGWVDITDDTTDEEIAEMAQDEWDDHYSKFLPNDEEEEIISRIEHAFYYGRMMKKMKLRGD